MFDAHDALIPFGNPDGSRQDLDQIVKGFVSFGNASAWGGLSTSDDDRGARILVGRKGSGKTLYLRRLQAHASKEDSLYADSLQQDKISTSSVIKFCQWFGQHQVDEKWTELWHRAILRSVISHLLCNRELQRPASEALRIRLETDFPSIIRNYKSAVSVYSSASSIIYENNTQHQFDRYINEPVWHEIESAVADALRDFPPLCFYLDAVDEQFEAAPLYWLHCQKGLFYECMRLLRDSKLGGRLHVVICIRDIVFSSVLSSEHQSRYRGESHIRVLNWNKSSISYFLEEKIKRLPKEFLSDSSGSGKPITCWLGISEIDNLQREIREPVEQYLLRHTRLLPRDVISLGNLLCQAVSRAKAVNSGLDVSSIIRSTVSKAARTSGNEQLEICANEFVSSSMPKHAAHQGYDDSYIANADYAKGVIDHFKELIALIGKDRFNRDILEDARSVSTGLFAEQADPWSILWRNGLIGYVEGKNAHEKHIFYSDDRIDQFRLPDTMQTYLFHPILIDCVGIESRGPVPVIPFRNGEV